MTTSTSNTGWLASAKSLLTRASTAAGFAPKGHTGPTRELTTLATKAPNKPAASRWNWWGTKASSPIAPTPQDTAPTLSVSAKPQSSGWLSTYNPFTRWTGAKATAEPSASAASAENNITHLASTKVDEWLSKTREVSQSAKSLYTELKSLTVDERDMLFRSAPHMCGGNWEKTVWNSLTPSQLKELEIDVDTAQQDTTGKGLRAARKNAAQVPKELTTLSSKPDETENPGLKRRRSVTFADGKTGAGTTMTTGGASTGGPIRGILKNHLPTPAASSLVTVN